MILTYALPRRPGFRKSECWAHPSVKYICMTERNFRRRHVNDCCTCKNRLVVEKISLVYVGMAARITNCK